MKNDYARRRQAFALECFKEGMNSGEQFALDVMEIALHKEFGWGFDRIKRLLDAIKELGDYYIETMHYGMEQDVRQEQMDCELRAIVGDRQPFIPFSDRYPIVRNTSYEKLPKR